jgi:Ni2+-binding GTPase involved in maturation of urease and hydrogenase
VLFAAVSGFLGAGKTTLVAAGARALQARGLRVAVVANDQGSDLVDSAVFRAQGLAAGEVAGGCFCCRFDQLVTEADRLLAAHQPDVILAEAVGSCTDILATVYRPLRRFHPDRFELAPLSVLVEADRLREMERGFPGDVAYVFGRQLAEAELVVLTKVDLARTSGLGDARERLGVAACVPLVATSAVTGEGVSDWVERLLAAGAPLGVELDVDYAAYARGEARLGWLNAALSFERGAGLAPRALGEALGASIAAGVRGLASPLAHVKVLVASSQGAARLSLVRADGEWEWSGDPGLPAETALSAIVNVRMVADPDSLARLVRHAAGDAARSLSASVVVDRLESFAPKPPVPRHRLRADGATHQAGS